MTECPYCGDWDEEHTSIFVSGIEIIGCPKHPTNVEYTMLRKPTWDEVLRLKFDMESG